MGRTGGLAGLLVATALPLCAAPASAASVIGTSDVTFGNIAVGTNSTAQTVTVTNSGTSDLQVSGAVLSNNTTGEFSISTDNCAPYPRTLAASASCTYQVRFAPVARGAKAATLVVSSDAGSGDNIGTLNATGVSALATLQPTSLSFGDQALDATGTPQTVTITNDGDPGQTLSLIVSKTGTDPGDFTIENNLCAGVPKNLAHGASC